jgi:hypothetical protein
MAACLDASHLVEGLIDLREINCEIFAGQEGPESGNLKYLYC